VGRGPPGFTPPQLATLVNEPPAGADWVHEVKFDGYRLEGLKENDRVRLLTRTALDWTAKFPGIAAEVARLPARRAILDGEAVALLPDGRSSFQALQQRIHSDPPGETVFFAFDLLGLDGEDLRPLPLTERKARLAGLLRQVRRRGGAAVRYSEHTKGRVKEALARVCRHGLEGLIAKRSDAPYQSGRGRLWLKVKCQNRQEFVVIGFTDPRGKRRGIGALLLGVRDEDGKLRYTGRVGTGMNESMLASLKKALTPLGRSASPAGRGVPRSGTGMHWVEPRLVVEVTFTEWTKDGALRHPSFVGLREDKAPREVRREEPMQVAGITLSNADRVLYPKQGLTKQDLAAYYEAIAPWMLPHVEGRPLSLVRCPSGTAKACFYQKHWSGTLPEALDTVDIKEGSGEKGAYTVVHDAAGLVSLVQHGVLEIHLWGAREDNVDSPDRIIFDLDPAPGVSWTRVKEGALRLKTVLEELSLETWIKTTGGKGLHVALPIARRSSWSEVSAFARAVAQKLSDEEPEKYLAKASKSERKGRIFVDWLRNTRGATAIAPWSTRAREGAPISAPISWKELTALKSGDQYGVENAHVLAGKQKRDPWGEMIRSKQRLTGAMLKRLSAKG
jgi:bifunctional non-homologous end joining protein LigD